MKKGDITHNFSVKEFLCKCHDPNCEAKNPALIQIDQVEFLQSAREDYGAIMSISSGLRCVPWNIKMGGMDSSSHLTFAMDIVCSDSFNRRRMIEALLYRFKRIGIAKNFIHVDNDPMKDPCIWTY